MISNNEYKILGVNSTDDMSVIKVAFRKLASKYHPDKNNDSDESNKVFLRIKLAYENIRDYRKNE